jgi:hypothetical protein
MIGSWEHTLADPSKIGEALNSIDSNEGLLSNRSVEKTPVNRKNMTQE